MEQASSEKKARLQEALGAGMVMIHLDARRPGVKVPDNLKEDAHLRLNLSYRFEPHDLTVNDWGLRSTLSFGGIPFQVAVPWNALFAVRSHVTPDFWIFPEDIPEELNGHQGPEVEKGTQGPSFGVAPFGKPALVEAPKPVDSELKGEAAPQEGPPPAPVRNHLRLVK